MIRRFEPTDLSEILQIEAQAFPKSSYTAEMFFDFYRRFSKTFLVFEKDRVRGYIIFEPSGHVISLAVDPPHRRKGIGTHLMQACESHCKGDALFVEVRKSNMGAQKFYERLGFHFKGKIRLYYGTEDAYLFEKKGLRRD